MRALVDVLYGTVESVMGKVEPEYRYPIGMSIDGFVDCMIWGDMGAIEPPYAIHVINLERAPKSVFDDVALLASAIAEARRQRLDRDGVDIDVRISY